MLNSRLFSQSLQLRQASVNKSVLKNGDKGNGVSLYQAALIRCGHPMPLTTRNQSTYPDGIFGKETEDRTRQFQRENGLYADGVVGKNTLGVLDTIVAKAESGLHDDNPFQRHPRTYQSKESGGVK
ncbi:peptidoglycan-binding domain-containing protein [Roseibium aggregatum]|uniref:Peptidoglycan-binding protein n=1 Tax=Roseibium aggregatum TaxID=187304 RepID=A0A939EBE2_9HYPH|nr:peptidoglycan-binding domain-containing protein [Roseibium aggregatum]MBN9669439.1 peptidoglycan-binding protein [Roseibium aggregatum]